MAPKKTYDVALIYQVTETELKKEWDTYETRQQYDTAHVCMCVYGGALDYPKIVSKGCKDIIDSWEMVALTSREHGDPPKPAGGDVKKPSDPPVLPEFANEFGKDGWLKKKVVKPFEEACKLLHSHILKMNDAIMEGKRIRHMYILLSTTAIIRNRLWFYCEKIEKDIGKPVQEQYTKFRSLVDILVQETMNYHTNLLQNCVLMDPESMEWSDPSTSRKQQLSYHVLFWWCHMQGLKADLWEILPPKMAQDIFAGVLIESLAIAGLRYGAVTPSMERLEQYRVDIMSILLLSSDMVLAACATLRDAVENPEIQQKVPFCIGLRCQMLLLLATVVGCPLTLIQKFLKKTKGKLDTLAPESTSGRSISPSRSANYSTVDADGNEDDALDQTSDSRTIHSPLNFWMTAVRPDLYPSSPHYASSGHLISSGDPPAPTQQLFLQVSYLAAQPKPQWHLIVQEYRQEFLKRSLFSFYGHTQTLLSHDFGLATLLFHNLEQQRPTVSDWYSLQELKQPDFCNGCLCNSAGCCDQGTKLTAQDVYTALLYVLVHVGGSDHNVLLKTLFPAILPRFDFQIFDKSQVWNAVRPHWLQALVRILEPFLAPVIEDVVGYIRSLPHVDDVCMENLLKNILANLYELCYMLPPCVRKFVNTLQTSLRAAGPRPGEIQPLCGSLCVHLLVNSIFTFDHTNVRISPLDGGEIEPTEAEVTIISNMKERLCHLYEHEDDELTFGGEIRGIHQAFMAAEEMDDALSAKKMALLKKLDIWSCGEEVAQILVAPILADLQGKQALQILHNTLTSNVFWARQVLGMPGPYMMDTSRTIQEMQIPSWKAFGQFNPFKQHRTFQGLALHHAQVAAYPMNWDLVFAFVFTPLSARNVQTLLRNRPDLTAPSENLDEETKRCVEYMKRQYEIDNSATPRK